MQKLMTRRSREEWLWTLLVTGITVTTGIAARQAMNAGWRRKRTALPPGDPGETEVHWPSAIAWSVSLGLVVALARLVAGRAVAAGWRRSKRRAAEDH